MDFTVYHWNSVVLPQNLSISNDFANGIMTTKCVQEFHFTYNPTHHQHTP